tara:strand:- start:17 stop:355 length:339 start_codon:yes stop_codon:yes gene_type:complete
MNISNFTQNMNLKDFLKDSALIVGACFAGYTVTHLPPKFLKLFETPIAQFIIFFILFESSDHGGDSLKAMIISSLIYTIIFNILIKLIHKIYSTGTKIQEIDEDSNSVYINI